MTITRADDRVMDLGKLFPADRFVCDAASRSAFESDGLAAFRAKPLAVVIPETADEIVAAVRWCFENDVPFVARGSGTSLSGGSLPVADGIVIALNRMNRILDLNPDARTAVVEPGVINLKVSQAADPYGLYFAPDPSSQTVCTIGGNVAFNAGGAHCLKYGMTSNHVLGMKVVTAAGEVVTMGGASTESIGPDYTGLFCGSEGLFGIALEITLRLLPKPEMFHTVLIGYDSLRAAGDAVSAVIESGLLPGAIEIMDAVSIEAAEAAVKCNYPTGAAAVLIVELEGPKERIAFERELLQRVITATSPVVQMIAKDHEQRMGIWKGRKSVFSAVGRLSPDFLVQDGVVPRNRLGEALVAIEKLSVDSGIRIANVFHAGDGNLHPLIMFDGNIDGMLHRAEAVAADLSQLCISMGGSITGEHGVGMEKRDFLAKMYDANTVEMFDRLRRAFDPKLISNPGKMFPGPEAPSLGMAGLHPLEKAGVIQRE
ncbi:FAD-binding oxidoreductase [Rubripirellula reticaptiva]|uniref:Putative FAD-linked oxidoreductase n=1 Tax=Rubripirellula reticaptiva TaxID=2528013 RepID=A0A5C6EJD5_9BACT|nr:FAD-linked oxidase C-terminal domain-containing protein [Rubripirellula reticaptiva]TWU47766.1 putative FAD-linked oxidoreductase [Rubripirellula reticaptiva]